MVELKGSLTGIGLPAIVQLIGELHHTGTLQLGTQGVLAFDDGRLVAAEFGQEHGLQALASCVSSLAGADFTFSEGAPTTERTLDLGPAELKRLLNRLLTGDTSEPVEDIVASVQVADDLEVCALLGFADDRARHYSRPTALHRCYPGRGASLVTAHEQRELCLSGRFESCPRFRNVEHPRPAVSIVPDAPVPEPHEPAVPHGVAARMAAASQLRLAQVASDDTVPTWIGHDRPAEPLPSNTNASASTVAGDTRVSRAPSRSVVLIAGGALIGLIVVALVLLVAMPALNSGLVQKPSAVTGPAFEPVATATRVAAAPATKPTTAPAPATKPTSLPTALPTARPATPTAAPNLTVAGAPQSLMDVRLAAGPPDHWLDNPPFASWSDGAYRFQAAQAARFVAVGVPINRVLGDIIVSATFRKTGGPPGGGYGVIVRDQGPEPRDGVNQEANAYVFETGDLGEIGIWRRAGDHWVDLVPWTRSTSVRPGGSPNELTVRAVGDQLSMSVNGVQVASVQDDTLMAGGVGLFVGGDHNEVALDRFSLQLPD